MNDLSELLVRVAAATGPDRDLDADIAIALANLPFVENLGGGWFGIAQSVVGADYREIAPPYTASINIAEITALLRALSREVPHD